MQSVHGGRSNRLADRRHSGQVGAGEAGGIPDPPFSLVPTDVADLGPHDKERVGLRNLDRASPMDENLTGEVRIREASDTDASRIVELFRDIYGSGYVHPRFYDEREIRRMVFDEDTLVLVAEDSKADSRGSVRYRSRNARR